MNDSTNPKGPIATGFQCSCVTTLTVTAGTAVQITCPNCGGLKFVCQQPPAANPDLSLEDWLKEETKSLLLLDSLNCRELIALGYPVYSRPQVLALLTRMRDRCADKVQLRADYWANMASEADAQGYEYRQYDERDKELRQLAAALRGQSGEAE